MTSLDLLSKYLLIMELGFDTMLCSNFGHENSDAGHVKCSRWAHLARGPQVPPVMCPSHFCRVRVTSPSSQSHPNFFRVRVMTWSSRITRTVESLRIIGLQARVNVESHEISRFFYNIFFL